jgi:sugar lactone lactonase YvrE
MSGQTTFSGISEVRALPTPSCELGENPLWDAARGQVYWTDIPRGRIYSWNLKSETCATLYEGELVAGITLQADGNLLLFRVQDVVTLCPDSRKVTPLLSFEIPDGGRFNDVIAAPDGSVFCGRLTVPSSTTAGGVWWLHKDGKIEQLWSGTGIPNGMGFTKDLKFLYWTCSSTRTIFRYKYDVQTGTVGDREVFLKVEGPELPDGLTVDGGGLVFSARWNGFSVAVLDGNAQELGRIALPAERVTSVAAGGDKLDLLFITTAGGNPDSDVPEGKLYVGKLARPGKAEFVSKILINS